MIASRLFDSCTIVLVPMSLILNLLTLSYSGALRYHTTDPIKAIEKNNDYVHHRSEVIEALAHFRLLKQEELQFVNSAVRETLQARCYIEIDTDHIALHRRGYRALLLSLSFHGQKSKTPSGSPKCCGIGA
jgi:hypothetical protein